jgi:peptide/nickel transport system substrate-binding protein
MKNIEELRRQISAGKLSRREFVKRATAMGAASMIPAGLLVESAQAAKRGGHLRLGFHSGSTTDSLDTEMLTSEFTNMLHLTMLGQLTEVAPDGSLKAQIAESFEPNATADQRSTRTTSSHLLTTTVAKTPSLLLNQLLNLLLISRKMAPIG